MIEIYDQKRIHRMILATYISLFAKTKKTFFFASSVPVQQQIFATLLSPTIKH